MYKNGNSSTFCFSVISPFISTVSFFVRVFNTETFLSSIYHLICPSSALFA